MAGFDAEPDDFFELLTDALKSGPGTAAWTAVQLRLAAGEGTDEDRRLLAMREQIESVKSLPSITASPQLKLAVMAAVAKAERHAWWRPRASTTASLAVAAAMVLVAATAIIIELTYDNPDWPRIETVLMTRVPPQTTHNQSPPVVEATIESFESAFPPGWRPIGPAHVKAEHGLRLVDDVRPNDDLGGMLWLSPLPANKHFDLDVSVRYVGAVGVMPEIFVTDQHDFDNDRPDRQHEFVWTIMDERPQVRLSNSTLIALGKPVIAGEELTYSVSIKMSPTAVTVETHRPGARTATWTGDHLLSPDKPWRVGLRLFVINHTARNNCVAVNCVKITER